MDFLLIALTLLFALTLSQCLSTIYRITKNLPPGPTPLPLIGNLHLLGSQPHKSLAKLAKSYGPIMCLKLGRVTTVVISSPSLAKEVLQKHDLAFSDRCIPNSIHAHDHHKYSSAWLPVGSQWRSLRKIMNSNIFSANKLDANQSLRLKAVEQLIEYCRRTSQTGEPVDVGRAAFRTSLNLLCTSIFSEELADPYSDSGKEFMDLVSNIMVEVGKPNLVDFFPVLEIFDPQGIKHRLTVYFGEVLKLFQGLINERLEQKKSHGIVRNDILEILVNATQENPKEIEKSHVEHMCLDLFVAGTDTTSSTLEWAMTELLQKPEIMKRAKEELAQVIGKGKPIEESDIARLPYMQCIVKETFRLHPAAPLLLPRTVAQDVELSGCIVPKKSQVLINAWEIGRDSNTWKDSLTFNPERFWKSKVDVRGVDFEVIPFGAGRRICPGMPLAIRMISLMLGSLLNSFDWKLEKGISPGELDMEETFGLTLRKAIPLKAIPISI